MKRGFANIDWELIKVNIHHELIDNGGRRSGFERRRFSFTYYIPERRSNNDRRSGQDRRSSINKKNENRTERHY